MQLMNFSSIDAGQWYNIYLGNTTIHMPTHAVTPSSNSLQKPKIILSEWLCADWLTVTDWVYVRIGIENFETK